jgi:hypothetical protein
MFSRASRQHTDGQCSSFSQVARLSFRVQPALPKSHFVWSKADWPALKLELCSIDLHALIEQSPTIDVAYNEFVKVYTKACNAHIPKSSLPYKLPKTLQQVHRRHGQPHLRTAIRTPRMDNASKQADPR